MSCEQLVRKVLRSTSAMQNLLACLFLPWMARLLMAVACCLACRVSSYF